MAMESLRIAAKESKFMKFILGGFILLAVGGLVFTDVRGFFSGGVANTDIAQVGDRDLSLREFDNELRRVLQQSGMIAEDAYEAGLINAYLEGRINSIVKLQAAEDLGLRLSNAMIARQIRAMFGPMPREQIEMILQAQGLNEDMLAASVRRDTLLGVVSTLPQAVSNYVPSYVEQAESRLAAERRSGTLFTIPLNAYGDGVEISDEDILAYYNANPNFFTIPEQRKFTIGTMTVELVKQTLPAISEEDLRAVYEDQIDDFAVAETREIAQANLDNPDNAQAVYELAMDGMPLKTALENVTGSGAGFRDTASYTQDGLPEPLADRAFDSTIQAGDVTPPVKTLVGYTIMKVVDIAPARQQNFNEVKEDIKQELQETRVFDALYNKMLDTEDMIDGGKDFENIAEQTDLVTNETDFYTQSSIADTDQDILTSIIQSSPATLDELFTLPEGSVTYPLELDDGSYAVVEIKTIQSAEIQPLEDVHNEIRNAIINDRRQQIARETLAAQIQNDETINIPDAAKREGFDNLGRESDRPFIDLVFQAEKDGYAYDVKSDEVIIVTVSEISFDETDANIDQNDTRLQQAVVVDSLLTRYYRDETSISVNDGLLERTYGAADDL